MDLQRVVNGPFQENTWIVGDGAGKGCIVDPGFELERVVEAVEKAGLEIVLIVCTHGHIDHAWGVAEMKTRTGAPFAIHPEDEPWLARLPDQATMFGLEPPEVPVVDRHLVDGEVLDVGAISFRVAHTPGHSPGGCCLIANGHAITGDSIFSGSIGRVDLPGGSWETYQETIRNVILPWPDELILHPGHGPDTTMAEERRTNPYLVDQM